MQEELVPRSAGPHPEAGLPNEFRVTITERGHKAPTVPFGEMPLVGSLFVRSIIEVGRTKPGVIPGIHLFEPPDLEYIGISIDDRNRTGRVLNLRHRTARVIPVV